MGRFSSTLHICCNITEGHPPSTSQKCMSVDLSTLSRFTSLHNATESSVSGSGLWPVRPIRFCTYAQKLSNGQSFVLCCRYERIGSKDFVHAFRSSREWLPHRAKYVEPVIRGSHAHEDQLNGFGAFHILPVRMWRGQLGTRERPDSECGFFPTEINSL